MYQKINLTGSRPLTYRGTLLANLLLISLTYFNVFETIKIEMVSFVFVRKNKAVINLLNSLSSGQLVENGFNGCLQNLKMNDEDLPTDGSNSYVTAKPNKVSSGCKLSIATIVPDKCVSSPCQNGGRCSPDGENGFNCTCPEGVKGPTCGQDSRQCASNPCSFNAKCTNLGNDFKCECPAGLSGKTCDEGYDCTRQPCKNGGTCEKKKGGKQACSCLSTFTGPDCSLDVDECASAPCKNGGVCDNTFGGFFCNCSAVSYGGTFCEKTVSSVAARKGWPLGQTEIISIAVVISVLLLVVILVVVILRWRAKKKRQQRAQEEAAKPPSVLKVSPPVVGSDVGSPEPPTPPPREVHGFNGEDLGLPPGYDADDSWRRRQRAREDFGTMKTLNSISDNNLRSYHWDYTDIPDDLVPKKPPLTRDSGSYDGSPKCARGTMDVTQQPNGLNSSQGSLDVPQVPKRPRNYRVSESDDGYGEPVPHVPKKPLQYLNPRGNAASRYSMDSRQSELSDATDLDPDIFKGHFPRPPKEPYPESLDQHPVGSYAPTLTARGSELGSITDGMMSEDDLEQVYLGNRMEACDDSPENSYLHSENCSEDEDDEVVRKLAQSPATPDPDFHKALRREIKQLMDGLEELKFESEI